MKKILIIDYDQNSLTSLQGVFAGQGYQVVTAADGQSGWDRYNKESPDLVLMEAMLPKVHGFELCQRITSERNSQATVFIMTGVYKDRVYRTEALRTYGASEYFEKPLKMAELLASVEAVLGKPEPRPAEAPTVAAPAAPRPAMAQAAAEAGSRIRPGAAVSTAPEAPADARRRERPKVDDSIFALPADLDRLSKDLPKARKASPVPSAPAAEPKADALADELLKTVLVESSAPQTVKAKPAGGNGNGNNGGGAGPDIDQFLRSALAGFDLDKEKVKAAKPVPPPPSPAPPSPVKEKPAAAPVKAAVPEAKPAPAPPAPKPAPAPAKPFAVPAAADMKSTLTPGDPGSDVSPFFVPDKTQPAAKPVERTETARHAPARREPERREPPKVVPPAPAPAAAPVPERGESAVIAQAGIFQDIAAPKEKKGFPKILVGVLGLAAVGAVAFILLRPKPQAPPQPVQTPVQTAAPVEVAPPPVKEEAPAPKPAPKKAQPQAKPADTGASAILPAETSVPALPLPGTKDGTAGGGQAAPASNPSGQVQAPPKTEETPPTGVKTEPDPPQNAEVRTTATPDAGAPSVSSPGPSPAAPVNTGDLVELGSVTEQPRLIKRVDPVYPQTAQRVGRGGSITVNALIDEKGSVIDTAILKGIQDDKGLARAAETAIRKWKFQPALKNGVAVKVWKSFVIAFKAEANPAN